MNVERVWDYPRPPRLEAVGERLRIVLGGVTIADTANGGGTAYRVLETSHPPTYYFPRASILESALVPAGGRSFCEWKGTATYFDVTANGVVRERAGWTYERPFPDFAALAGHVAFYAGPMDACFVGDELVTPQPGGFYGGWITPNLVGPFKGAPGTNGW
ncbi:MAG: DUF427 domain-containing protein [Myxococcaceae bacterium]|jgi:uncharacterized protein (DUF427 family)|nr:DUF427 domain-containing protein [Myxococcaceae bacterium]